jgi:hypothetical protein
MSTARSDAARLRGSLVGATSTTVTVAAHGLGGASLPATSAVLLLVAISAMVGAVASSSADAQRRLPVIASFLGAGQLIGHYVLAFASGHHHGAHWSTPMILAHAAAALLVAALICSAERSFAAVTAALWRLVLVLVALVGEPSGRRPRTVWWGPELADRVLAGSGHVTRGPPSLTAA